MTMALGSCVIMGCMHTSSVGTDTYLKCLYESENIRL
jgi:hypothetical protein